MARPVYTNPMSKREKAKRTHWHCNEHQLEVTPVMPFRTLWECPKGHWVQIHRDCVKTTDNS